MREKTEQDDRLSYIEDLFAPEDRGLLSVRRRLEAAGRWGINIGPSEGRFLQVLMKAAQVRSVVEIGTLFGYSTVWMARALPSDGRIYTLEKDTRAAAEARVSFGECGVDNCVELLEGEAAVSLKSIEAQGPFDMVFIDCNKSGYPEMLDWAERNIRTGGLVVGDNTWLFGAVTSEQKPDSVSQKQWAAMREFNKRLADPNHYCGILVPTSEGMTVAVKLT